MHTSSSTSAIQRARTQCLKKFLYYFNDGFRDATYIAWERQYKLDAHRSFMDTFSRDQMVGMLGKKQYRAIADTVLRIESKTNLLFSFEKMAIRDAVKSVAGAKAFSLGLFEFVYGEHPLKQRFEAWVEVVRQLPRKQTRVLTWPVLTVFGFIANPAEHIFLKPRVTQRAARAYQFDFRYASKPTWETYASLLSFAEQVRKDTRELRPKDYIDLQSFLWVLGSDEYPD